MTAASLLPRCSANGPRSDPGSRRWRDPRSRCRAGPRSFRRPSALGPGPSCPAPGWAAAVIGIVVHAMEVPRPVRVVRDRRSWLVPDHPLDAVRVVHRHDQDRHPLDPFLGRDQREKREDVLVDADISLVVRHPPLGDRGQAPGPVLQLPARCGVIGQVRELALLQVRCHVQNPGVGGVEVPFQRLQPVAVRRQSADPAMLGVEPGELEVRERRAQRRYRARPRSGRRPRRRHSGRRGLYRRSSAWQNPRRASRRPCPPR